MENRNKLKTFLIILLFVFFFLDCNEADLENNNIIKIDSVSHNTKSNTKQQIYSKGSNSKKIIPQKNSPQKESNDNETIYFIKKNYNLNTEIKNIYLAGDFNNWINFKNENYKLSPILKTNNEKWMIKRKLSNSDLFSFVINGVYWLRPKQKSFNEYLDDYDFSKKDDYIEYPILKIKFIDEEFKADKDNIMHYYLFFPKEYSPDKQYPLLVFFHGAGERGNDSTPLQSGLGIYDLLTINTVHNTFILVPQCPHQMTWGGSGKINKPVKPIEYTIELIKKLLLKYPIDKRRIYSTGQSLGAIGAIDIAIYQNDLICAVLPIAGAYTYFDKSKLIDIPMWFFIGDKDFGFYNQVMFMVEKLRKAGAYIQLTIYKGANHFIHKRTYLKKTVLDWLFSQRKEN